MPGMLGAVLTLAALPEVTLILVAVADSRREEIPPDIVPVAIFVVSAGALFGRPI